MKRALFALTLLVAAFLSPAAVPAQEPLPVVTLKRDKPVDFEGEILPLLRKSCLACHNASDAYGELILESPETIRHGGDSGPAVVAGKGEESRLLRLASHRGEPVMPPEGNDVGAENLTPEELGLLKLWIDQGAKGSLSEKIVSPKGWRPLPPGVNPIYAVAVTPDGQFAACGRANQIFIYHVPSGQLITRLTDPDLQERSGDDRPGIAHLDIVQSLAFNAQGDLLASGGFRTIKLWRYPRDVQRQRITAGEVAVTAVAVRASDSLMATGSADGSIELWNRATGEPLAQCAGHQGEITDLQFTPGGERLVSSSTDGTLRLWNPADGKLVGRIDAPSPVRSVAVLTRPQPEEEQTEQPTEEPEGVASRAPQLLLASGGDDNLIRLWNVPTGLPAPLEDLPAPATAMAVSPNGAWLAFGNQEGAVQLRSQETGKIESTWPAHGGVVTAMSVQAAPAAPKDAQQQAENGADDAGDARDAAPDEPSAGKLATASSDSTLRVWNMATGKQETVLRGSLVPLTAAAFHPSAPQVVAGAEDGKLTLWNLAAPAPRALAKEGSSPAQAVAVSPDGKQIAAATREGGRNAIAVHELQSGKILQKLLGHDGPIAALAFSPDGTRIASASNDGTARVWQLGDAKFPELARFAGHEAEVRAVAFSADGAQVLSGAADGSARLWDARSGQLVTEFAGSADAVVGVGLAPGNWAVSGSTKSIVIYNTADGKQARTIASPSELTAAAMSSGGQRVASASAEGGIRVHQVSDGKLLATFAGQEGPVSELAFSADAARLVSAGEQQAIVWRVADGRLLEMLTVEAGLATAAYGPTAETILLADRQGGLSLHSLRYVRALGDLTERVTDAIFHSGGGMLYVSSTDGTVRGFNIENGQQAFSANHGAPVHDLALSPDGGRLASAGEDKLIKLFNASNGGGVNPSQLQGFASPVRSVAFAGTSIIGSSSGEAEAGGHMLVFSGADGVLEQRVPVHAAAARAIVPLADRRVVSLAADGSSAIAWEPLADGRISGHSQPVTSLAGIEAAPLQLVSGSLDGTVRHWNVGERQQVRQMNHGAPVTDVAVRPDGGRFASTSENKTVRLWNAANGQQIAEMKGDIREQSRVTKLTQRKAAREAKLEQLQDRLKAAEEDLPKKQQAEKDAAEKLAAANKEVGAKSDALTKAESAKAAAEKQAIQMAAAAQKAAKEMQEAEQLALLKAAEAELMADKVAEAKAVAATAPEDESLAQAVTEAEKALEDAQAAVESAQKAMEAPAKAADDASKAAGEAAQKAVAMGKPYTDALSALQQAQDAQRQAQQIHSIAARESKAAAELVPALKSDVGGLEEALAELVKNLEAATEASAESEQPLRAVAFSPEGLTLATGGDFGAIHTWDAETGAAVASYRGHAGPVHDVAFTPDAGLASASADKTAAVWELKPSWRLERRIGDIADPATLVDRVAALDFNSEGTLLAAGGGVPSRSGELKIFRVEDGAIVTDIPHAHEDSIFSVAFSRDGKFVASGGADKYVRKFDAAAGELVQQFEGHTNHVLGVAWRADGRVLASAGADNTIRVWNAESGDRIRTVNGFDRQVFSLRFIGQSQNVVSCSGAGRVRMHRTDNGQNFRNFAGTGGDYVYGVDVTPDGRIVVAGGYDSVLRIWNGQQNNSQPLQALEPPAQDEPQQQIQMLPASTKSVWQRTCGEIRLPEHRSITLRSLGRQNR